MSDLLSALGLAQARNGNPTAGLANARRAITFAERGDGADGIRVGQHHGALAEVELRAGNLPAAEAAASRGVQLLSAQLPEDAAEVIGAIGFLSEVYEKQGRFQEQEKVLRKMLEVRLRTLDPASSWAITARNNLAQSIQLQGRLLEAIALMRENERLLREKGDTASPQYLIGANNVASLLEQSGDYDASARLFEQVLEHAEREPGAASDPNLATYRQNLGRSLMLAGRLDAAWPLLNHPVDGVEGSADSAVENGRRLIHLAEWMRRSRRPHEALDYIDQAEQMFATVLPAKHPRFGGTARMRGLVLRDQGKLDSAETELRRAVSLLATGIGPSANATLDAELQLAEVLIARGKSDEARILIEHVTPLAAQQFVVSSPVRQQLAELQQRLRRG